MNNNEDYKIRYNQLNGYRVTDWMNERKAKNFFNKLKNEKELKTIWAELIFSDSENENADEEIIEDFERKTMSFMGKKFIV